MKIVRFPLSFDSTGTFSTTNNFVHELDLFLAHNTRTHIMDPNYGQDFDRYLQLNITGPEFVNLLLLSMRQKILTYIKRLDITSFSLVFNKKNRTLDFLVMYNYGQAFSIPVRVQL